MREIRFWESILAVSSACRVSRIASRRITLRRDGGLAVAVVGEATPAAPRNDDPSPLSPMIEHRAVCPSSSSAIRFICLASLILTPRTVTTRRHIVLLCETRGPLCRRASIGHHLHRRCRHRHVPVDTRRPDEVHLVRGANFREKRPLGRDAGMLAGTLCLSHPTRLSEGQRALDELGE